MSTDAELAVNRLVGQLLNSEGREQFTLTRWEATALVKWQRQPDPSYDGFVFLSDDVPKPPTDDTLRAAWTLALSEADYETIKHALVIAGNATEIAKGSDASERFDVLYDQLDEWNHSDKP